MDLETTFDAESPPAGLTPPVAALWWIGRGGWRTGPDWNRAHDICQSAEGDAAHDLVHAVAHLVEGDQWNADYWYRRAGSARQGDDPRAEWRRVLDLLTA